MIILIEKMILNNEIILVYNGEKFIILEKSLIFCGLCMVHVFCVIDTSNFLVYLFMFLW
jgi:hypothetical protein